MKKLLLAVALVALTTASAYARTFHYACTNGDDRYSLTVNEDRRVVKMSKKGPPHTTTTFRILKVASIDECAKYGWILSGGAQFCTATQGVGDLHWNGQGYDCDQADTE